MRGRMTHLGHAARGPEEQPQPASLGAQGAPGTVPLTHVAPFGGRFSPDGGAYKLSVRHPNHLGPEWISSSSGFWDIGTYIGISGGDPHLNTKSSLLHVCFIHTA